MTFRDMLVLFILYKNLLILISYFNMLNLFHVKVTLQDPEIKIKSYSSDLSQVTNGNATLNLRNHEIEWELELDPSETKIINLKYQLEHSKNVILFGI